MHLRDRLDEYTWLLPEAHSWTRSPAAGVARVMLDRAGGEIAKATSLVRYAPGSRFKAHEHPYGEEFVVLDGEFVDEHGAYPAYTYVRNPHGSRHVPGSPKGCVIFVRLRQMAADDSRHCVLPLDRNFPETGFSIDVLHEAGHERVVLVRAAADTRVALPACYEAQEALLIDGQVQWQTDQVRTLLPWSWLRVPPGHPLRLQTLTPSLIYVRTRMHGFGDPSIH